MKLITMKLITTKLIHLTILGLFAVLLSGAAQANPKHGYKTVTKQAAFADVRDDLKDAIINRGFVVDYVGHFNTMLLRTSKAAGSVTADGIKSPYKNAQYLQFCAAKLTHEAISADPRNIANCPYVVFVYEMGYAPGKITVGYRLPAVGPTRTSKRIAKKIEALLDGIVAEAAK